VIQPADYAGGTSADRIGVVKRSVFLSETDPNAVDAATASADGRSLYSLSVFDVGPAVYGTDVAALGMRVEKTGSITGHRSGKVVDVDFEGDADGLGTTFPYRDCLLINPRLSTQAFSDFGDSGSLVFSKTPIPNKSRQSSPWSAFFTAERTALTEKVLDSPAKFKTYSMNCPWPHCATVYSQPSLSQWSKPHQSRT
jgi:hypothetical protein